MTIEGRSLMGVIANSQAEVVREEALASMRRAKEAVEAEATALWELEEAYLRVEEATTRTKSAIETEAKARLEFRQAQDRAKQTFIEAEKATRLEVKANKARERKDNKLRMEEAKLAKAERNGKQTNQTARDEARQEADEVGLAALEALHKAEKAREAVVVANKEVNEAQGRVEEASTRNFMAKEAEAEAKKKVAEADVNARNAINEAQEALEVATSAKKTMDWAIKRLKALKLHHANTAHVGETDAEQTDNGSQQTEESRQTASSEEGQKVGAPVADEPTAEFFSGSVRLLIASPVDRVNMQRFQKRLEQTEGFRVTSVGGSSAIGASITISTERPFPLLPYLRALELVERVSMKGRQIEVTLRPVKQEVTVNAGLQNALVQLPDASSVSDNGERPVQQEAAMNKDRQDAFNLFPDAFYMSDDDKRP